MNRRDVAKSSLGFLSLLVGCKYAPISTMTGTGTNFNPYEDKLAHGHLDGINSTLLYARLQIAKEMQTRFGSYSVCGRCRLPWSLLRSHITWYEHGNGIFALCEDCWSELVDSQYRLPYYRELFQDWCKSGKGDKEWAMIELALKAEDSK